MLSYSVQHVFGHFWQHAVSDYFHHFFPSHDKETVSATANISAAKGKISCHAVPFLSIY